MKVTGGRGWKSEGSECRILNFEKYIKITMAHFYRMMKEYRSFYVVPVFICVMFILIQCILQNSFIHSPRRSLTYSKKEGKGNGGALGLMIQRSDIWKKMSQNQQEVDSTRIENDEKQNYYGLFGLSNEYYTNDPMEQNKEEIERLNNSPYIYHESEEIERLKKPVIQKDMKYVSFYRPYDATQKSFKVCRYNMCTYAENLSQADVIAFKAALIRDKGLPNFKRPKNQRWVLFTSDPASKNYNLNRPEIKSKFNATCTYRLDSDIQWTFGKLRKIMPPSHDYDAIYNSKDGLVAWFVSHCQTFGRREEYVRRMQTVTKIDVFGLCSNLSCGNFNHRKDDTTSCLPMLSKKYKFYLSFENTFCEDYITEKFFKLFKNVHVIPVVRGGVDYRKHFPSGVFVNAADFDSPEKLAKYLAELGNDKERYLGMLRAKSRWVLTSSGEMKHCKLCEYAHTQKKVKYYPNVKEAFNGDYPHCWRPTDII